VTSAPAQIYSPFEIDRVAGVATMLGADRMTSGRVARFDARAAAPDPRR
jgi:hypothetical protein